MLDLGRKRSVVSTSFVAKLTRMRIKLVTGLHCFRVLISVGFSLFCAASSVMFLPRPQGSKSLLFIYQRSRKRRFQSLWAEKVLEESMGVQDRKKLHHMQEILRFSLQRKAQECLRKHWCGIGEICPQFLFTHISLLPVPSFSPSLTKGN